MAKPTLYLETTIPSYLVGRPSRDLQRAADQATTRQWWDFRRAGFQIFTSVLVHDEIARGEAVMAAARIATIRSFPTLQLTPEAQGLAERLLREQIVPAIASDDAFHISLAAGYGIDFLLTWNCKHINNKFIVRRIERACAALGLACPVIATPAEMMNLQP